MNNNIKVELSSPKRKFLTLRTTKVVGFLVATESVSADQFISDKSYPKLGLCH